MNWDATREPNFHQVHLDLTGLEPLPGLRSKMTRRGFLRLSLGGLIGTVLGSLPGCTSESPPITHPSIFLTPEDLPRLRESLSQPAIVPWYTSLLAHCDRWLGEPSLALPTLQDNETTSGKQRLESRLLRTARMAQGRILSLAFAGLLTGHKTYTDRARLELLNVINDWPAWTNSSRSCDLMTAETSFAVGVGYDWLYDVLSVEERKRVQKGLLEKGFNRYLQAIREGASWIRAYHNWNAVLNGGFGTAALAVRRDVPRAAEVLSQSRRLLERFYSHLGADGGWDEGTGYWAYAMSYALRFETALLAATGEDNGAFQRPGMARTGYFPIFFNPGGVPASFGDNPNLAAEPILYLLSNHFDNPAFTWYADTYGFQLARQDGWPREVFAILWRQGTSIPNPPPLPAVQPYLDIGWASLASGWPKPEIYLSFKSGDLSANHAHLDLNSFQLIAWGEPLAIDPGPAEYSEEYFGIERWQIYPATTAAHNCVLIEGRGQTPGSKGKIVNWEEQPRYTYLVGDASSAYSPNIRVCRRHLVFVDRRYFVLLDEIVAADPVSIEMRLHTHAQIHLEGRQAILQGQRAQLQVVNTAQDWEISMNPGQLVPAETVLFLRTPDRSPTWAISAVLYPFQNGQPAAVVRTDVADQRMALEVTHAHQSDEIVFELRHGRWMFTAVTTL